MLKNLQKIKQRVADKESKSDNTRGFKEVNLIELHHRFMKSYGWIPISELRDTEIDSEINLVIPEINIPIVQNKARIGRFSWFKDIIFGKEQEVVYKPIKIGSIKGNIITRKKGMPLVTFLNLLYYLQKDAEEEQKQYEKAGRKNRK